MHPRADTQQRSNALLILFTRPPTYPPNTRCVHAHVIYRYCDAQCPHDIKFINGEANILNWQPSSKDSNSGIGQYGTCCTEMDIWEANSQAWAVTPHTCTAVGQTRCNGTACGDDATHERDLGQSLSLPAPLVRVHHTSFLASFVGIGVWHKPYLCWPKSSVHVVIALACGFTMNAEDLTRAGWVATGLCDKDGADWNPYRLGDRGYFGAGSNFTVDSTKKMTVVTSFHTTDGTDNGDLTSITRTFVQDGVVLKTRPVMVGGTQFTSVTDPYASAQKKAFNDTNMYEARGGMKASRSTPHPAPPFVDSMLPWTYTPPFGLHGNPPTPLHTQTHTPCRPVHSTAPRLTQSPPTGMLFLRGPCLPPPLKLGVISYRDRQPNPFPAAKIQVLAMCASHMYDGADHDEHGHANMTTTATATTGDGRGT